MIRVRLTVTVTEVDGLSHEPVEGAKPEGFVVGNDQIHPDYAPTWAIDREVQRMLVETMPAAYVESEKRWAT